MKRIISIILLLSITLTFCACNAQTQGSIPFPSTVHIPEVDMAQEEIAENVIVAAGLVPVLCYEYSENVPVGQIIRTEPANGIAAELGTQVKVYVSNGPEKVTPVHYWVFNNAGDIQMKEPKVYIEKGIVYVEMTITAIVPLTLTKGIVVSADEDYKKIAYAELQLPENTRELHLEAGESYDAVVSWRVSDLEMDKPVAAYFAVRYYLEEAGDLSYTKCIITATWE